MATIADLANAVAAEVETIGLGMPFTVERGYFFEAELEELKKVHIAVAQAGLATMIQDRKSVSRIWQIQLGVRKKLETMETKQRSQELDLLVGLVSQLVEGFELRRLADLSNAIWIKTEYPVPYNAEHLKNWRQFTAVVSLSFRMLS